MEKQENELKKAITLLEQKDSDIDEKSRIIAEKERIIIQMNH